MVIYIYSNIHIPLSYKYIIIKAYILKLHVMLTAPGALRGGRHTPALRPGLGRRSLRQGAASPAAPAAPAREKWDVMVIP